MSDENIIVDRHLYLTEDRSRVVEEGDPTGRWLWASPGQQVKRRDAEELGAVKSDPEPKPETDPEDEPDAKTEPDPEPKQRPARPNKQRARPADKAAEDKK